MDELINFIAMFRIFSDLHHSDHGNMGIKVIKQ